MRRNVVIVGGIILLIGLAIAIGGFFLAKSGIQITQVSLSPSQGKTFPLKSGVNSVSIGYNTSLPPKVEITGNVITTSSSKNVEALLINGTSPSVYVEDNSTTPMQVTLVMTQLNSSIEAGGLAFILGVVVFFVGLGILIYGLIRR
ncbi:MULTISPECIES: hypothetical protein [Metallosphaera]|uniref:Uncharacterized protein n=3 Tax=Metallosphaera TaxID=41980 RepID=A4YDP0_METS5|nr:MULTISPECIES: hypothetical protein [Metallosphaera]ABP94542.1 hypothetical protein Msed_0365 [Metallosphaera sedula DSM 5348]AIM26529.1 hypothetical protein HA72_0365 [Metallosphaera sedula]AKV73519.1 hypothetical protein MsedA_0378 [Metallosphaera sedula]AKV75761.1 hypothetical protein MsedB_0378 [Metallosphaera sedula]AKV78008.1 hypothetical protein MsedC_0377 [Metallosphaera sedula]